MYTGNLVFSQVMEHLPPHVLHRWVDRYYGNFKVYEFTCLDHYLCMAFAHARKLYLGDDFVLELDSTVYALDSTTIDLLCLSKFPWAIFRQNKGAVKRIPCEICAAISRPSSTFTMASSTMPKPSTFFLLSREPSISWIGGIWISCSPECYAAGKNCDRQVPRL